MIDYVLPSSVNITTTSKMLEENMIDYDTKKSSEKAKKVQSWMFLDPQKGSFLFGSGEQNRVSIIHKAYFFLLRKD